MLLVDDVLADVNDVSDVELEVLYDDLLLSEEELVLLVEVTEDDVDNVDKLDVDPLLTLLNEVSDVELDVL